jgi:predicted lipid-binding transport protein (Tim44 family)
VKINFSGSMYGKVVLIILAVAGVLIFLDSFSWKHGGMSGLWSFFVIILAIGALIIVTLAFFAGKISQYFLGKSENTQQQSQDLPTHSIQAANHMPENADRPDSK